MTKQELITQLERIIETLKEEDVLINRVSIDHTPIHETAKAYGEGGKTEVYKTFKGGEDFDIHIDLEHRVEKEVK